MGCVGQLDVYMEKNEVGNFLTSYKKVNSKWIKDLIVRGKTLKLIENTQG